MNPPATTATLTGVVNKTAILVLSITLIVFVPAGLRVLIAQSAEQLTARADATPLLIGAKGSPLELVLSSLYFSADTPPTIPYGESSNVRRSDLARPIPMYVRFHSRGHPIVGDPIYGEARWKAAPPTLRKTLSAFPRPALHAWRLSFEHPATSERLRVEAPVPDDLEELWRQISGDDTS